MSDVKIGELLLSKNLATDSQIAEALKLKNKYPGKTLGQILCQMGFINKTDLDEILDHYRKRQKLGDILISQNIIDERKLAYALSISTEKKHLLGQTLLKLNYIEEEQLSKCIANQYDLPYVSLKNLNISLDLGDLLNFNYAKRHKIVPISKVGKTVTFAMVFPLGNNLLLDVEHAAKIIVNPVIATESDVVWAQNMIYRKDHKTGFGQEENTIEISEDDSRDRSKTKYLEDFISAETERLVRAIISAGVKANASDIHLESDEMGMTVRYRVDGMMQSLDLGEDVALISKQARPIISRIKILSEMDIAEKRRSQDGSFRMRVMKNETVRVVDFRVATLRTQYGEDMVIRVLDKKGLSLSLKVLGFPAKMVDAIHTELDITSGIFLVTGPTGSGKSATLHALLAKINKPGLKSMTVEDPIEYSLDGVRQTEMNEDIGNSFSNVLRTFMRQDPDNIMIGEIRDPDTAALAVRAALTGHTILSSLQTNDATSAVTRLLSMGIDPHYLASTLRCVIAQRLVRVNCSNCREQYEPSPLTLSKFSFENTSEITMYRGKGCPSCAFTGFSGRRPIVEFWVPTSDELLQVSQKLDNVSLRSMAFNTGKRQSMIEDGIERVKKGETTLEELLRVVPFAQIVELNSRMMT
ncbi:MAG: ATPase, T2SS/T4P/T4SS family [Deltaproteobacteria bacterium]|nr:ATPase, T2SS/T4P/T4SS family [Deltaproteobacteria bacterium]